WPLSITIVSYSKANMEEPLVVTEQGPVRGKTGVDYNGGKFYSFQGIPYAQPPYGHLRFKAPQPPKHWDSIWDATQERDECYASMLVLPTRVGSEDCLYLNVYTPGISNGTDTKESLKPVMVWIHGEAFTAGSSKAAIYGPEFLLAQGIVLVTLNYRLGCLGFLSLEDSSLGVPGNAGLKDQVQALKWVQQNIHGFLGDPNNVTLFGESAGLFHKAIIQSGSALSCRSRGSRCAAQLAKNLGFESENEALVLEFLQQVPVDKLIDAQEQIKDVCRNAFSMSDTRPFAPVVEKPSNEPAILTEEPLDIIISGNYNKVPLIVGYNNAEGLLMEVMLKKEKQQLVPNFDLAIPYYLGLKKGSTEWLELIERMKEFYFGQEEPTTENLDKYVLLVSDAFFIRWAYNTVKIHQETLQAPIYLYRFTLDATLNLLKMTGQKSKPGAAHADELGYLFKTMLTPQIDPGSTEDLTIRRMTTLWTNFAKYSDPNPKENNPLTDVVWKPVTINEMNFLEIGEELSVGVNPEADRMAFWDSIFGRYPAISKL
ncbi:esterase, partial [Rhyzopertha dominica]